MFSNLSLKSFRILLLPFSLIYWLVIGIRNWLFDKKIFKSHAFGLPVICIGNLSVGGTGKSPMVEFLLDRLGKQFKVATLSRGYKRKTKGYALANSDSTALEIGDEPMQFHLKFPDVAVAVGERRIEAIPQLLHDRPDTTAIILDDAFQHRSMKAGLNILLTEQHHLYTRDFYLPAGDLRDLKSSYRRADLIVVTKCDSDLDEAKRKMLEKEIRPLPRQALFFATMQYGRLYHIINRSGYIPDDDTEVLLVTGIANPQPLKKLLEEQFHGYQMLQYMDHHIYTIDDIKEIREKFNQVTNPKKIILTTEKDAVRLNKFRNEIASLPLYVIPVRHHFLFNGEQDFLNRITTFISEFRTAKS